MEQLELWEVLGAVFNAVIQKIQTQRRSRLQSLYILKDNQSRIHANLLLEIYIDGCVSMERLAFRTNNGSLPKCLLPRTQTTLHMPYRRFAIYNTT